MPDLPPASDRNVAPRGRRRPRPRRHRPAGSCPPHLEPLEERAVPTFLTAARYPVSAGAVTAVAAGDFNGNGATDIVYAAGSVATSPGGIPLEQGAVGVELNYGSGHFQPLAPVAVDGTPGGSLAVGDFNHDGVADVAVAVTVGSPAADVSAGEVAVLLGAGPGVFQPPVYLTVGDTQDAGVATADLNHDGNLDLVVAGSASGVGRVTVLLGTGTGAFVPAGSYPIANAGDVGTRTATAVAVGDFSGDGSGDDVAVASDLAGGGAGQVNIFHNPGPGVLVPAGTVSLATASQPTAVAAADLNGDGRADLVVTDQALSQFHVALNQGDGTFAPPTRYTVGAASAGVAVADFNRDGRPDLAVGVFKGVGTIDVFLNNGGGTFKSPLAFAGGVGPVAADFNGDKFPDLAAGVPSPSAVAVLMNDGSWQAGAAKLLVAGYPSPTVAGVSHAFTVTVVDAAGNVVPDYNGTVHFSSSDPQAILPAAYTFTAADHGLHTFAATFKTAGTQTLAAVGRSQTAITGRENDIVVDPAAASRLVLNAPASITAGSSFTVTVTAVDPYGNIATGFRDTVSFRSSDPKGQMPGNYTFTAADEGQHTFTVTLRSAGRQTLSVTDLPMPTIFGNALVTVFNDQTQPTGTPTP